MSGNVHQSDKDKLKATVDVAADQAIEVTQADASKLKGTVTQLAKDRTVTGNVTVVQPTSSNLKVEVWQDPFGSLVVEQGTAAELKATVTQLAKDRTITGNVTVAQADAANLKVQAYQQAEHSYKVNQATAANLQVTANQSNAPSLKATVTQAAKDRTVTGTATVTQIPLSTMLSSAITLTSADTDYLLPASEQSGRSILVIYNISDATVYIGGSGVTTAAGMPLASSKYMVVPASANVYAVCGFAGKVLRLSECK